MKVEQFTMFLTIILGLQLFSFGQNTNLSESLKDTQVNADKASSQALFEFSYDFKVTNEEGNSKKTTETYESVCAEKHCEYILIKKNGESLSEKEITNNRQNAAKKLEKSENYSKPDSILSRKFNPPYDFLVFRIDIKLVKVYFNPNFYLKTCKINFVENSLLENRQTIKVSATNCKDASENTKKRKHILPKTEALIWIDEKDKTVVKLEIYGENEIQKADEIVKPTVVLEAAPVPEGFWFWKSVMVDTDNKNFFGKNYGSVKIDFFNYKKFNVDINKAEVDKKQN